MLTALAIENAKPRDRPYKITDGSGLHLLVTPSGSKLWRFRYRFAGKQLMLSFGAFPEVSLTKARAKRDDARTLIADGKDPSQQKKLDKIVAATAANNTYGAIAEEHLAALKANGAAEATLNKVRWLLLELASANRGTAICVAFLWPAHSLSSAIPRFTAPSIGPGSQRCWHDGRPKSRPSRLPTSLREWLGR
jgi:hypothetical protein